MADYPTEETATETHEEDSVLTKAGSNSSKDAFSAFTPSDHRAHGMYSTLQYKTLSPQIPVFIFSKISVRY